MSPCNSVNLVKESGLKTILSFYNNTGKVFQTNVAIISLNSVPDFWRPLLLMTNGQVAKVFPCSCYS